MSIINYIGYFFAVVQGVQSAQWSSTSPKDGSVIYGCVNDVVSIPWEYVLGPGDSLDQITWQYDGHSQEMIDIFSHGHFIPMPAFSNRVSAVSNAGISIRNMLVGDSGNYSVEVRVFPDSGIPIIMIRSVFIHISEAARSQVAFQARYLLNPRPPSGTPIIFSKVIYNQGQAYSSTTGYFTAPFSGVYFFISTTGLEEYSGGMHLMFVDDLLIASGYTQRDNTSLETAPVHAVVHVNKGQRVWINGNGLRYWGLGSMFSGFLLSQDV